MSSLGKDVLVRTVGVLAVLVIGATLWACTPDVPPTGPATCQTAPNIPSNKYMSANVSGLPVDPNSSTWIGSIIEADLNGNLGVLSGRSYDPARPPGNPVNIVPANHAMVDWVIGAYNYFSDPNPYPDVGGLRWQGWPGNPGDQWDAYLLTVFGDCRATEQIGIHNLFGWYDGSGSLGTPYRMVGGVKWDAQYTPRLIDGNPNGMTAAFLPLTTGVYRDAEALAGTINHVGHIYTTTCRNGPRTLGNAFIWPARSTDCFGGTADPSRPPYGAWLRLKSSFAAPADPRAASIVAALKTYGAVIGDGGQPQIGGPLIAAEEMPQSTITALESIPWSAFEFVDAQGLRANAAAGVGDADYWNTD